MSERSSKYLAFGSGDGFLHRADPINKLAWLVVIMAWAFILTTDWRVLLAMCLAIIAVGKLLGNVPLSYQVKASAPIWLMLFSLIIINGIFVGETVVLDLDFVTLKAEGLDLGLVVGLRMLAVVLSAVNVVRCMDPKDLVQALVMYVRIPYRFAYMIVTSLNFLPVIQVEVDTIEQAQMVRGIPRTNNVIKRLAGLPKLIMPIMASGIRRAYYTSIASDSRGFGLYPERTWRTQVVLSKEGFILVGATLLVLVFYFIARYAFGIVG